MPDEVIVALIAAGLLIALGGFFLVRRPPRPPKLPREEPVRAPAAEEGLEEPAPAPATAVRERPSLRDRLDRSRRFLSDRIADALHGAPDEETWDDLEAGLIQ